MTVITTSTADIATAYPNQRKVDRTSNGVLWTTFLYFEPSSSWTTFKFCYSTDNGVSWYESSSLTMQSTRNYTANASLFIDVDDYAHIVYKDQDNGYIYYRRGTPNAARTAWTWSAAVAINSEAQGDYPDIVAHREGAGWTVHIVMSRAVSGVDYVRYRPVTIDSGGTITAGGVTNFAAYSNTVHKYPSIDFQHTGDGKTVKGAPNLFVSWSAGTTGAGKGIRFKQADYNGPNSWTWGTEVEINNTVYMDTPLYRSLNCVYDGSNILIGGNMSGDKVWLWQRSALSSQTTPLITSANNVAIFPGSMTYDSDKNIYITGRAGGTSPFQIASVKYDRATGGVYWVGHGMYATQPDSYLTTKRSSGKRIEFIYTDLTASPYNVTYDYVHINTLPSAPTNVAASGPVRAGITPTTLTWTHNDIDGDSQTKYRIRWRKKQ